MTEPVVFTRWCCDQCQKQVSLPGAHDGLPDAESWKQITLLSSHRTTKHWGQIYSDDEKKKQSEYHSVLACSLECAQLLLAEKWRYV